MINKLFDKYNTKYNWAMAAALTMLFTFFSFWVSGMVVGDYLIMRSDLIAGSIAVIKDTARNIINGENIWFSFNIGMGLDNALALASNVFSPFNILYVILYNVDLNVTTAIVIILKLGCMAGAFQFFAKKVLKNDGIISVVVAICYAMCSFSMSYGTIHIMWEDALIILPLLCCAIVKCINENKRLLLIILYTYLFVSHFYMGYIVGIFSLLFVALYLIFIFDFEEKNIKYILKKSSYIIMNWGIAVIIAILISSVVWVPTLFFIVANRVEDSTQTVEIVSNILSFVNSLYWGEGQGISGMHAYVYCGILPLLVVPFYFFDDKNNIRNRLFWGIILAFYGISLFVSPLNIMLHAFDQPDSFWYRYSFIISFLLCSICVLQYKNMKNTSKKIVSLYIIGLIILYVLEQQLIPMLGIDMLNFLCFNSNYMLLINIAFMIAWVLVIFFLENQNKQILIIVSILLIGVEVVSNAYCVIGIKEDRETYCEWKEFMESASANLRENDEGLYRTIITNCLELNADTWFGINGINDFGDQEKYDVRNFMSKIGFATSTRLTEDTGYNPVSNMLLGVKYNIICPSEEYLTSGFNLPELNEYGYYKVDENLSIGYMVELLTSNFEFDSYNGFENLNDIVKTMTGIDENCFVKVPEDRIKYDVIGGEYSIDDNGKFALSMNGECCYFYVLVDKSDNPEDVFYIQFERKDPGAYLYDYYFVGNENSGKSSMDQTKENAIIKMFYVEDKECYSALIYGEAVGSPELLEYDSINVYYLDRDVFLKQYEELSKEQLKVDEWSNGHIEGTVNVDDNKRLMFTSIPYDAGWTVLVDGMEVDTVKCADSAFLGFLIPSGGEHSIVMDYECPGLKIGVIGSICGIIALMSVIFEKQLKSMSKKKVEEVDA